MCHLEVLCAPGHCAVPALAETAVLDVFSAKALKAMRKIWDSHGFTSLMVFRSFTQFISGDWGWSITYYLVYHSIGSVPLFLSTVLLHGLFLLFFWCFWVEFLLNIQNCPVPHLKAEGSPQLVHPLRRPERFPSVSWPSLGKRYLRQLTPAPWCISRIVT